VTRRGTASPARAKLLRRAVLETRSHAVGQSLDKRTFRQVGRGHPVGLYAPLHMAGLPRDTSINRATTVGREIPEPTPAFSLKLSAFTDAFRPCPLDLQCLASLKSGAHEGLAMRAAKFAALANGSLESDSQLHITAGGLSPPHESCRGSAIR
jgi:hypothetical protein